MNPILRSIRVTTITRRYAIHRFVGAFRFALFSLVTFAISGVVVDSMAQSPAEPKAAATPEAKQGQKPGAGANPTPTPVTGTIRGRVVSDEGRPVTNATVLAQSMTGAPGTKPTRVDAEGKFVFDDLPAAAYTIFAMAPGYVDQSMSHGDPSQWPRHLLGAQVKITMIKGGVITGTVTNSKGDPVVGLPVSAAPAGDLPAPGPGLQSLGTAAETDDRGIYRIFGLLPGQYIVTAGGGGPFGQFTANGFDLDVPTFYPSTTRDAAIPVSVRGGEETTRIDIKYRGTQGHSISGVVTGGVETSAAMGAVTVLLSHAGTTSVLALALANTVNQRMVFNFNGVADGEYDLLASFLPGPTADPLLGTKRVTVRGGDVTGIDVKLVALGAIAGTITLDPIKPEDRCDKRASEIVETVIATPRDEPKKSGSPAMIPLLAGTSGTLNTKGEFAMRNLEAGRYRLEIKPPTEAWYVRSITPPSAQKGLQPTATAQRPGDTWQGVATLKSGERLAPFSIMVGQDAAGLRGHITVTSDMAIPVGLRVHLIPEERERVDNILRYSETLVSADGSFAFTNLAPGRYFVVARIEPPSETQSPPPHPAAWDPTARMKLRRVAEAANAVVELKPCQRLIDFALVLKTSQ